MVIGNRSSHAKARRKVFTQSRKGAKKKEENENKEKLGVLAS
jgi:hypothetical protein